MPATAEAATSQPASTLTPNELRDLNERQDAMEIMLVLLASQAPNLDGLIDTTEAIRDAMSAGDRRVAADALDSINKTLKLVAKTREARARG